MATNERYEQVVAACKALRAAYSDAGVDFFEGLMVFEADETAWKLGVDGPSGFPTFGDALHASNLTKVHRYERFKQMVRVCGGVDRVRSIGLDAAEAVLDIPDRTPSRIQPDVSARAVAIDEMLAFRLRNGHEPSSMSAASIVRKHFVPEPKPAPVENAFDRLKRENAELRKENSALQKENKALQKENKALRKRVGVLETRLGICERSGDHNSAGTTRGTVATQ